MANSKIQVLIQKVLNFDLWKFNIEVEPLQVLDYPEEVARSGNWRLRYKSWTEVLLNLKFNLYYIPWNMCLKSEAKQHQTKKLNSRPLAKTEVKASFNSNQINWSETWTILLLKLKYNIQVKQRSKGQYKSLHWPTESLYKKWCCSMKYSMLVCSSTWLLTWKKP